MVVSIEPEIDFLKGNTLVPSKALQYKTDDTGKTVETLKPNTVKFETALRNELKKLVKDVDVFPIKQEVVLTITHGLHSKKEYDRLDLDNRAKTICDALKKSVLEDDSQIKVLLCNKVFLENTFESYYRFSVKICDQNIDEYIADVVETFRTASSI